MGSWTLFAGTILLVTLGGSTEVSAVIRAGFARFTFCLRVLALTLPASCFAIPWFCSILVKTVW